MTGKKILLALLPYWTPLIPPQGIAILKGFLKKYGCEVKTVDANVEKQFKDIYEDYFSCIRKFVPERNWGNLYNIGHDMLRNHMMAHFNQMTRTGQREEYLELIRELIYQTFFWHLNKEQVILLDDLLRDFYVHLENYSLSLLKSEKPDVVGVTGHLGTLSASMFFLKMAKQIHPQVTTVLGGTIFMGEMPLGSPDFNLFLEKTPYIDKIIVGEGQNLLLKLLRGELPQDQRIYTLADINHRRIALPEVNLPDLTDFDLTQYPYMAAFGSTSCPNKCRFCNIAGFFGEYRKKDISQTVNEMMELHKKYGYQLYFMNDSLLNPIITELSHALLQVGASLYMDGYLRVSDEVCDGEKTLLWRRGGFYRARMGIESGAPRLLKLMRKGITCQQSGAALSSLAYAGIKTTAYFVIGFPGETEEDFKQTLEFLETFKNEIWEAECNPFYYYYTGQPNADIWAERRKLLYPGQARDWLITQTWIVDGEPSREERFERLFRFVRHCNKLGIPNPYSYHETYLADKRWQTLHQNAVPALVQFKNNSVYIEENKKVKELVFAQNKIEDGKDFMF